MNKVSCIQIIKADFGYKKNNRHIEILKQINLQFNTGDFIGIAGLNGSGKSTLLKTICGLLPLLNGQIYIDEIPLSEISNSELAKKVAIVLTDKISGFNLTSFDAVAAGQLPYTNLFNKLEAENLAVVNKAIETCGIKEHHHKLLSELSDGLFQKTMIAKCLAQQTPIMLLDEPSAFLDYASKHELFLLLKNLANEQKKCIMVSTHDLDLILKYCNKILLVRNSTVELISVSEAKTNPIFKELSGGYL